MNSTQHDYFIQSVLPCVRSLQGDNVKSVVTCTLDNPIFEAAVGAQYMKPVVDADISVDKVGVAAIIIEDNNELLGLLEKHGYSFRFSCFEDFLSPTDIVEHCSDINCPIIMLMTDMKLGIVIHKDKLSMEAIRKEFSDKGMEDMTDAMLDEKLNGEGRQLLDQDTARIENSKLRTESILESAVGHIYSAALSIHKQAGEEPISNFRILIIEDCEQLREGMIQKVMEAFPGRGYPSTVNFKVRQEDGELKDSAYYVLILSGVQEMDAHCVASVHMQMGVVSTRMAMLMEPITIPKILVFDTHLPGPISADIQMDSPHKNGPKGLAN